MTINREKLMDSTFGYGTSEWQTARTWVKKRLRETARANSSITYGDLAAKVVQQGLLDEFEAFGAPMESMLAQINLEEQEVGNYPLLSVLVVKKDGNLPGAGFFRFARETGSSVGSSSKAQLDFWTREIGICHSYWSGVQEG